MKELVERVVAALRAVLPNYGDTTYYEDIATRLIPALMQAGGVPVEVFHSKLVLRAGRFEMDAPRGTTMDARVRLDEKQVRYPQAVTVTADASRGASGMIGVTLVLHPCRVRLMTDDEIEAEKKARGVAP